MADTYDPYAHPFGPLTDAQYKQLESWMKYGENMKAASRHLTTRLGQARLAALGWDRAIYWFLCGRLQSMEEPAMKAMKAIKKMKALKKMKAIKKMKALPKMKALKKMKAKKPAMKAMVLKKMKALKKKMG